jgi:hypothetical protein
MTARNQAQDRRRNRRVILNLTAEEYDALSAYAERERRSLAAAAWLLISEALAAEAAR